MFELTGGFAANNIGDIHGYAPDSGVSVPGTNTTTILEQDGVGSNGRSRKKRKSQARRDRWAETACQRSLKEKYREFNKGAKAF